MYNTASLPSFALRNGDVDLPHIGFLVSVVYVHSEQEDSLLFTGEGRQECDPNGLWPPVHQRGGARFVRSSNKDPKLARAVELHVDCIWCQPSMPSPDDYDAT